MPSYDMEFVKQISVEQVLSDYGIQLRNGMFAVRNERTPSCKLYPETNSWADFGGGDLRGGGPVQLVMALDGISWADAVQMLGARYNAPLLHGLLSYRDSKVLSSREYALIGIDGSCAANNMLKPQYAAQFTGQQVQHIREQFNISMNELFKADPGTYGAILRSEALPFIRSFHNEYLRSLHTYSCLLADHPNEKAMHTIAKEDAMGVFEDYTKAQGVFKKAAVGTTVETIKLPKAEYEKDLANIHTKSIEIGELPYSELKQKGELNHIQVSADTYNTFNRAVRNEEVRVPPFSAHVKGNTVTVSCEAGHGFSFKQMFQSIQATVAPALDASIQQGYEHEVEM